MRSLVTYALFNAPWALITSLCAGLSTYLILLILSHHYDLATSGQFRLLLSIVGLIGLASLTDTGKILVKYMVMGVSGLVRPLMANRFKWSLLGMAVGLVIAARMHNSGNDLALPILVGSLLMPVSHSTRLFMQINQAKKQFRLNAGYNVVKYGCLVIVALSLARLEIAPVYIFVTYLVLVTAFHVYFITRQSETFERAVPNPKPYVSQSIKLSASGLFPQAAGHADKFLIAYFFDLETLGLYTIAVSTGRLVLNFVKPILTIYFGSFVNHVLRFNVFAMTFVLLTCIGVALAVLAKFYYVYVLPEKYIDGYAISAAILSGFGCYTIGVLSYYSAVYHRDSSIKIPTLANVITFGALIFYWAAALLWGGSWVLVLFAVSYPLRELSNLVFIALLKTRLQPA